MHSNACIYKKSFVSVLMFWLFVIQFTCKCNRETTVSSKGSYLDLWLPFGQVFGLVTENKVVGALHTVRHIHNITPYSLLAQGVGAIELILTKLLPQGHCKNQNQLLAGNVELLRGRGVWKIFSTSDDDKRAREKYFQNKLQVSSENIFPGRVWHHHELEMSFGRHDHTVISRLVMSLLF